MTVKAYLAQKGLEIKMGARGQDRAALYTSTEQCTDHLYIFGMEGQ